MAGLARQLIDRPEGFSMEFAPTAETDLDEYCRTPSATPVLSPGEETQLAYRIEEGDSEARERLVRANLRLVVDTAPRHVGKGLALLRVLQEGTHGLLLAVEAFDPRSGVGFTEHATFWIEEAINRAVAAGDRSGNTCHPLAFRNQPARCRTSAN
jgi:RNA polymerase primary sigma factor